jgi:hypothetical protein
MALLWLLRHVVWWKFTDVTELIAASIIRVTSKPRAPASTSETSVNFYQTTRHNNPQDSHVHTCRRENLKFHGLTLVCSGRTPKSKEIKASWSEIFASSANIIIQWLVLFYSHISR